MSTTSKRAAPVAAKRVLKNAANRGSKPFLRFRHSKELRAKTIQVLETIEIAENAAEHAAQLAELIVELTECGMDQYFMQSLKAAKVNFVFQQSAALGLSGVQKLMGAVIRNMIGHMDDRQLQSVCGSIRQFMA